MDTRSKPDETVARERLQGVALDPQGQVGDAVIQRHGVSLVTLPARMLSALGAVPAGRAGRPARRAAHRPALRAPSRRRPRAVQGRRPAAGVVAGVDGRVAARGRVRRAADRRVLALLAVAGLLAAVRLRALAGRLEGAKGRRLRRWAGLPCRPDDHVRRRLFVGGEIVFAVMYALGVLLASFAPDVWNTEKPMDMGFHQRDQRLDALPAALPVDERRDAQLLLLRPPRPGLADQAARDPPDSGYLLALGTAAGAHVLGGLRVRGHAVGGRPRRAPDAAARRAGAGRRARRGCSSSCSGTSPACARGCTPPTRRTTTCGSSPRA